MRRRDLIKAAAGALTIPVLANAMQPVAKAPAPEGLVRFSTQIIRLNGVDHPVPAGHVPGGDDGGWTWAEHPDLGWIQPWPMGLTPFQTPLPTYYG